MIGVVLWSAPKENKAVFWCEDQGDLAYYDGSCGDSGILGEIHPGDMVEFNMTLEYNIRHARHARLLETRGTAVLQKNVLDLANTLGTECESEQTGAQTAPVSNVVPLCPKKIEDHRAIKKPKRSTI